jgi:hypothetical protein
MGSSCGARGGGGEALGWWNRSRVVWVGRISGGNRAAALRCCGSPGGGEGKSTEEGARLGLERQARLHWKEDKGERTAGHRKGGRRRRVGQSGVAAVQGLCPTWREGRWPAWVLQAVGGSTTRRVERGAEGAVRRPGELHRRWIRGETGEQSRGGSGARKKKGKELN